MRLTGKQLRCDRSCFILFVVTLSFKVAAVTGPSQLELELTDSVTCRRSIVGRGESEHKAGTTYQLVPTSPAAKKRSVVQPIRTESTGSVPD